MGNIIIKKPNRNPKPRNTTKNDLFNADKISILIPFILDVFMLKLHFPSVVENIAINSPSVIIQERQIDKVVNIWIPNSGCAFWRASR